MSGTLRHILQGFALLMLLHSNLWAAEPQRVLFISAYHPAFPTFFQQVEGIKSVFEDKSILLDIEFMDSKRFPDRENLDNFYRSLSTKLSRTPSYDALITGDDNALSFILEHQQDLFPGLPVVFLGVNNLARALEQNSNPDITGVVEAVSVKETLELMVQLHPEAKRIVALVDGTPSGQGDLTSFYRYKDALAPVVLTDISLAALSFAEFGAQLKGLGDEDLVLLLSAYRDKNDKSLLFHESLQLITENLSRPLYHLWFHGMGEGVLGGKLISHLHQGRAAAEMSLEILAGSSPGDIRVTSESPNSYIFDHRELQRFGLDRSDLPHGSSIQNTPRSLYQEHKKLIWTLLGIFIGYSLLLVSMWFNIQRRKQAEEALRESEERFRSLVDQAADAMFLHDMKGRLLDVNRQAIESLGYTREELLTMKVMDIEAGTDFQRLQVLWSQLQPGNPQVTEGLSRRKDGTVFPSEIHFGLLELKEQPAVLALVRDISQRKLAEETLRESEKRQRLLLKNLQVGIVVHAADTRILMNNPKAGELLGLTEDQMRGKVAIDPAWRFLRDNGTVMPAEEYPVNQVISSWKSLENLVVGVERQGGKDLIWTLCGAYPLLDEQNRLQQVVTHFIDISERKQQQQELLGREAFESLIAGISTRFVELTPSETERGIDLALKDLGEFARVDRSYVFLFSTDGAHMDNSHEWCAEGIIPQKENLQGIAIDELPWAMVEILNKQVLFVPSVDELPPEAGVEKEHWQAQDIQSLIAVPILLSGGVIGFLGIDGVGSEKQWGDEDISLLQTVGDLLGNTIERQRAEESLQQALSKAEKARDKIEAILKSVADGLIYTDMDNRIILLSASAEAMLGRKSAELFMLPLDAALADSPVRSIIPTILAESGKDVILEIEPGARRQDQGRSLQVRSSLVRGENGGKEGVITLLRDVSRERELDLMKNEFISTAAHELRTPLTSVKGYAELLLSDQDFDEQQRAEFLAIINEKADVLTRIVEDLLNLSRVESGRVIYLKKTWQDLGLALSTQIGRYQHEWKTHRFEIDLPEKPLKLMLDLDKFFQVMENLLSNAVKYSPDGSLIQTSCQLSASQILVSVKDQGYGMTAGQVERVFDKFYRVNGSNTAQEGLGLGMSIAKNIVEAHGGEIWVESELDRGTTVCFSLPVEPETDNDH